MDDNTFNQWLYQGDGQAVDEDSEIALLVEAVDRSCHLSEDQKAKIGLAAHGDFARFNQDVDVLRSECVGKSYDQNQMNEIYQKFGPLMTRYQAGLLGPTSLFAKVVHHALTDEQRKKHEAAEAERLKARHMAKVHLFVALLEQSCPLKSHQRDALVKLLLADTRPAVRSSEYDWYVMMIQVAKIPDDKFQSFLDKAQLAFVKKVGQQGLAMEASLKEMGVLPK